LKPASDSTFTAPEFDFGCCMTIATPGCAGSVVRKTALHSRALSIVYFSLTFMVASGAPLAASVSAISSPAPIDSSSVESVIGIGQKSPAAVR
jgi:hypothetical protein